MGGSDRSRLMCCVWSTIRQAASDELCFTRRQCSGEVLSLQFWGVKFPQDSVYEKLLTLDHFCRVIRNIKGRGAFFETLSRVKRFSEATVHMYIALSGIEPIPVEMSSNHIIESSMDISDEKSALPHTQQKPSLSQPQQLSTADMNGEHTTPPTAPQAPPTALVAPPTTAVVMAPASASGRRDVITSRAEYMTSPVANGLIR